MQAWHDARGRRSFRVACVACATGEIDTMRSTWHAAWLALILSCGLGREALAYTPGKDGTLNIAADTVVNTYTPLVVAAGAGDTTITVENAATLGATPGDVLMIYQAQGATIDGTNTVAFGNVSALGNAGRFEFVNVVSVAGNVIRISDACSPGLRFAYSGAATAVPPARGSGPGAAGGGCGESDRRPTWAIRRRSAGAVQW